MDKITVRVNDDMALDAGTLVEGTAGRRIEPPATTMFQQLIDYLEAQPKPAYPCRVGKPEGVAAVNLCLRWGTFLAVLLDRDKPLWSEARNPEAGRINNAEMARINIEASANFTEFFRRFGIWENPILDRAATYLPTPGVSKIREGTEGKHFFRFFLEPEHAVMLVDGYREHADFFARRSAWVQENPLRVFANAVVNFSYRNGPVEDIHGGRHLGSPLDARRITPGEDGVVTRFAANRVADIIMGLGADMNSRPDRTWEERALPYAMADRLLITPDDWSLTKTSQVVDYGG